MGDLRTLRALVVALGVVGVVGCGDETTDQAGAGLGSSGPGGGVGTAPDIPSLGYCAPAQNWPESRTSQELEMLELVNAQRARGATCGGEAMPAREPLEMEGSLQCAARVHTLDMQENDYFSHTGLDGSGPRERMTQAGYEGRGWAENIAAGRSAAESTLEQWMNSAGHCRNIMGNYRYLGVGYVDGGGRSHLWTQTFGN